MRIGVTMWMLAAVWLGAMCASAAGQATQGEASGNAAAWSGDLPMVAGGEHLWLAAHGRGDDDASVVKLFHADWPGGAAAVERPGRRGSAGADAGGWERVVELRGELSGRGSAGLAAAGDRLWLMFKDGPVQAVRLEPGPLPGDWRYLSANAASLPRGGGATVVASAAGGGAGGDTGDRLWVLMRANAADAFGEWDGRAADATSGPAATQPAAAPGDASETARRELDNLVLGLPRNYPTPGERDEPASDRSGDAAAATQPGETSLHPAEAPVPVDRLAVLTGGTWRVVPLPDDWPIDAMALLVPPAGDGHGGAAARPTLLTRPDRGSPGRLTVYQPDDDVGWSRSEIEVEPRGDVRAVRVAGQLVLVQHHPTADGFMARCFVVRGGRTSALGGVVLDLPVSGGRWAALVHRGTVAVAAGAATLPDDVAAGDARPDDAPPVGPTLAALDLRGQPAGEPVALTLDRTGPLARQADFIIMVSVVVLATLLLFGFWRRDPTVNELALPAGLTLAPLGRRALAGVIDLTPGLLVGSLAFRLSLDELYQWWPGRGVGAEWVRLIPGLTTIAVTVLHTALLETLTARSLGKWCTGLRVTGLQGQRPRAWQALVRCGLKAFDLIAYLLLVLPVISPYRQRLGDMIASTVVVTGRPDLEPADAEPGGSS